MRMGDKENTQSHKKEPRRHPQQSRKERVLARKKSDKPRRTRWKRQEATIPANSVSE